MIELAPTSDKPMTYDEALMYCMFLEHSGKKGWRLPTVDEWLSEVHIDVFVWRSHDESDVGVLIDTMMYVTPVRTVHDVK